MDEKYNGWTNRETWNTSLWMNNDEGTQSESVAIVRRHLALIPGTRGPGAASEEAILAVSLSYAADELREWWDELYGPEGATPLSDAWSYAMSRTDWREITRSIFDGLTDE